MRRCLCFIPRQLFSTLCSRQRDSAVHIKSTTLPSEAILDYEFNYSYSKGIPGRRPNNFQETVVTPVPGFDNAGLLSMGSLKRQGLRHTSPDIGRSETQYHTGDSSYWQQSPPTSSQQHGTTCLVVPYAGWRTFSTVAIEVNNLPKFLYIFAIISCR